VSDHSHQLGRKSLWKSTILEHDKHGLSGVGHGKNAGGETTFDAQKYHRMKKWRGKITIKGHNEKVLI